MIADNVVGKGWFPFLTADSATATTIILRSRALAQRLEGWPCALVSASFEAAAKCEHFRMTLTSAL